MQVEYEDDTLNAYAGSSRPYPPQHPPAANGNGDHAEYGDDAENGDEGEPEGGGEGDVDVEEEEEEETVEGGGDAPRKPRQKRIIKQRQSLAEKQPGTTIFPISRVKRIIKADKELDMMTGEATFLVAVATEHFIKHFMEEGYTKARLDRRRIVNYRDMAAVVARSHEFDFLKDVVPAPMPMSEALELRKQKVALDENPSLHEDSPPTAQEIAENLPPLIPSTNPLFPNAVVKKPPNTHSKGYAATAKAKARQSLSHVDTGAGVGESVGAGAGAGAGAGPPSTPKVVGGKNAPSTPRSLTTRGCARRSTGGAEVGDDVEMAMEMRGAGRGSEFAASEAEEERMDED